MQTYKLRPYQQETVDASVRFLRKPVKKSKKPQNGIVVLPTAAGKSLVIANVARLWWWFHGWAELFDGLVLILTMGFVCSGLAEKLAIRRLNAMFESGDETSLENWNARACAGSSPVPAAKLRREANECDENRL